MAKFQLLSCNIALGGDMLNVVARHRFNPVTYPEMLTLRFIHGENSVTEIFDVGYVERDEPVEMKRLVETYGAAVVREKMFPGAGTRLPAGDNRYMPRAEGTKINPGAAAVPDLPTPDATVDVASSATPADYTAAAEDTGGYVPVEPPKDEPALPVAPDLGLGAAMASVEAAGRAPRRPVPVAEG